MLAEVIKTVEKNRPRVPRRQSDVPSSGKSSGKATLAPAHPPARSREQQELIIAEARSLVLSGRVQHLRLPSAVAASSHQNEHH